MSHISFTTANNMIELLIAILIALGCSPEGQTADELRAENPDAYYRATQIQEAGNYRSTDGGVVIVEIGGD